VRVGHAQRGAAAGGLGRLAVTFVRSGNLLLVVGLAALMGITAALMWFEGAVGVYLLIFSPVAMPMLVGVLTLLLGLGVLWRRLKAVMVQGMLGQHRCPACDFDMRVQAEMSRDAMGRQEREPSGEMVVRCPECGCGWRAARLGHTGPEAPEVIVVGGFGPEDRSGPLGPISRP
jgi:uncharacterized C2H2 Zn-finger protein